jgi:DNA-binding response OmpR family regulator
VQELDDGGEGTEAGTTKIPIPALSVDLLDKPEEISNDKKIKPKTKYKILVVEDDGEIGEYIKDELAPEYRVIVAENGKKALEQVLLDNPDLIISDVMMPEMDGITFVRKVKQNININHIPVILLTAKSTIESRIEGIDIGADAYITKPFNTELLRSTIMNLIGNRERLKNKFSGHQQPEDKLQRIEMKSSDEILMQRIMKIINENLSNPGLSVEMLAANAGMSRVHMHRKLKELTNQSPRDFIKGIRLKQAATLLSSKKLTISEVAYATGFSNLSHFSNSFRDFYGMSPKEYVETHLPHPE